MLRRCRQTSFAGDMLVSRQEHGQAVKQGGTADSIFYSSLIEQESSVEGVFLFAPLTDMKKSFSLFGKESGHGTGQTMAAQLALKEKTMNLKFGGSYHDIQQH